MMSWFGVTCVRYELVVSCRVLALQSVVAVLYSHEQLYIHICMQKYIQHNKDERTQFFRKIYLSLYWKGCVWEGVGNRTKTATYWPSKLFWLSQPFFPVFLGCSTRGLGAQPLLGQGSHSSIFSPTDLNFLSPGLYNNLTPTYFLRASQFALNSTPRQSRSPPDIFDRMHLLFTQVHFFFWQLGQGQYVTAGSISSGRDYSIHCWWDLIRSKQQSSVPVCRA